MKDQVTYRCGCCAHRVTKKKGFVGLPNGWLLPVPFTTNAQDDTPPARYTVIAVCSQRCKDELAQLALTG